MTPSTRKPAQPPAAKAVPGAPRSLRGAGGAQVAAQAKVNLRLRVLARETGGYHQIETLFLRLTLADQVRVRVTDGARSLEVAGSVDTSSLGAPEGNLAWRAAEAYAAATGWPRGWHLELDKKIPIGGGLGGGSADAAGVLRVLDAIAPKPIGEELLLNLAATLGADVPFLTCQHAYALGWGRGERLIALRPPPSREVMLLVPPFGVNTAEAYGWVAQARASVPAGVVARLLDTMSLGTWEGIAPLACNDFEPVVRQRHPEIGTLAAALRSSGCTPVLMSGSGSTVFGVLPGTGAVTMATTAAGTVALLTRTATRVEPVSALE